MFTGTGGLGLIPYSTYVDIVGEGSEDSPEDPPGGLTEDPPGGLTGGLTGVTPEVSAEKMKQRRDTLANLIQTNYQGQELTAAQEANIIKALVNGKIVPTEEEGAQALENYKAKKQYDSLSREDRMAYNDTAFAEFMAPTEEGVSPLATNEFVRDFVERANTEKVSFSEMSDAAAEILNSFLTTKLYKTKEEVEALRTNDRYNDMRRSVRDIITSIVGEATPSPEERRQAKIKQRDQRRRMEREEYERNQPSL